MNIGLLLAWALGLPFIVGFAMVGAVSWVFAFAYYMVPALFVFLLFVIEVIYDFVRGLLRPASRPDARDD